MESSYPILFASIIGVIFVITFIMYVYCAAIQNISDNELEEMTLNNERLFKKLNDEKDNPGKLINTVQTLTLAISFVVGIFVEFITKDKYIFLLSGAGFLLFMLVFGEIIPKKIGQRHVKSVIVKLNRIAGTVIIVFMPFTFIVKVVSGIILKLFGVDIDEPEENVTEEDIISVINEGHEQGVLLASEAEMINNIVEFGDKVAADIMTHRTGIIALDGNMTLQEVANKIVKLNKSRFPVYDGGIDDIIGVTNFRDVMCQAQLEVNDTKKLKDIDGLVRNATFIPETKKINLLFRTMQSEKIHMAIVIDEYGQTAGIVAMEDILEEIVGNILDEYDEEDTNIAKREDGSYVIKGITPLNEITDRLGISFDGDYDTLNGYLTSKFLRVLSNDERPEIVIRGVKYKILSVKNRMITVVLVTLPENEPN